MMSDKLHLYLITFNCALVHHDIATLSSHLLSGLESPSSREPDLIVLSLQEVAPLAVAFLGGPSLAGYFEPFSTAIRTSTRKLFGKDYALVARSSVGLTGIMVFARHPGQVGVVAYAGVGAGLWEMGNKGGVGVKLHYKSVEMNFLAAHLAPDEKNVRLRNDNWEAIVRGVVFKPPPAVADADYPVGLYSPTAHLFVLGDLNYRTSDHRPGPLEFLVFPQPTDHQSSNKHFLNLLEYDQLTVQRKAGRTLHGLEEAPVSFPPTYKYLVNRSLKAPADDSWNWMPLRWPSWTDRILYLPTSSPQDITVHRYTSIPDIQTSDHRPVVAHISIPATPMRAADGLRANPPFKLDPQWKAKRDAARRREIAVGVVAYLVATWTGRAVLLAMFAGAAAGWWVMKELVAMGM
jgi:hypothetical protein